MSEYDMYKVEASRQQLLEDFYQLMVSIDVIGDIKEQLMDEDEMETWGELTVLEGALQTRQPAAPAQPAAEGGADAVYDVQCRCGFGASQHWADGECPGDGYPYDDAPENHMHTHEDGEMYLQSLAARDQEVVALQAELADANARAAAAEAALKAANDVIDIAERNLPQDQPLDGIRFEAQAYSAWVAGGVLRAYKARQESK